MTKKDIERIIKQGTVKQQIKLYMTDVAMYNLSYSIEEGLLTDKERDLIWNNIKTDKDIKHYEELREWNQSFIQYRPMVDNSVSKLRGNCALLWATKGKMLEKESLKEATNEILNIIDDPKLRKKALKLALKRTKKYGVIEIEEENGDKWLDLDYTSEVQISMLLGSEINKNVRGAKQVIDLLTTIVEKQLPLKPYKDWLKEQIKSINTSIESLTEELKEEFREEEGLSGIIKITPYKDVLSYSDEELKSSLEKLKED